MTADRLLRTIEQLGIHLWYDGDDLKVKPAGRVSPSMKAALAADKRHLLDELHRRHARAVTARAAIFRERGQPWTMRREVVIATGRCFSCGDPLLDVRCGRCRPCSEALWRVLTNDDVGAWRGRPQ